MDKAESRIVSFAKLVGAVAIPITLAAGVNAMYVKATIAQSQVIQDAQIRDVYVTRREYDERNRMIEEKLNELRDEQRRARILQERIAAKLGVTAP